MPRQGAKTFTSHAVQRAMDVHAGRRWGAPEGYYTVLGRVKRISPAAQVWQVKVRLFGGRIHHIEEVVFGHIDADIYQPIIFQRLYYAPASVTAREFQLSDLIQPAKPRKLTPDQLARNRETARKLQEVATREGAPMAGTSWTQSEDRTLREDYANKVPIAETARKLGRSYYATSQRRCVLGIHPRPRKTNETKES